MLALLILDTLFIITVLINLALVIQEIIHIREGYEPNPFVHLSVELLNICGLFYLFMNIALPFLRKPEHNTPLTEPLLG